MLSEVPKQIFEGKKIKWQYVCIQVLYKIFFPTPEMAFSSNDLVDLIYAKPIAYTDIV